MFITFLKKSRGIPLLFIGFFGMEISSVSTLKAYADTIHHETPAHFIKDLGARALSSLTDPSLSLEKKEVIFSDLFKNNFAYKDIAKFVLGKNWRRLSPEQRDEFISLFEQMQVKNYTAKFDAYSNVSFTVKETKGNEEDGFMVISLVSIPDEATVQMDWKVFPDSKGYKILDITIDGVSMSITQRSEFSSLIERQDGDMVQFLKALKEKVSSSS